MSRQVSGMSPHVTVFVVVAQKYLQ
ncbi:unnamed protein product [Ectocarpus sp. CCAP 1310/34]|nr:unnamed protein product [Ectocarpus sp. CCAP 1310/34]